MAFKTDSSLRRTYQGRGPQAVQQNMPSSSVPYTRYTNPNGWDNTSRDGNNNPISNTTFMTRAQYNAKHPAAPDPAYGSQSGPGILESWFNQRANGTDPAYEYAMNRGMQSLGNQSAAAGNFNSGAARQQESDFAANMGAQRLGQLDTLAGGASGEHQNRVNSMFQQGQGLYGGMAGLSSAYDLGAAGNMAAANQAMTQMNLNSAAQQQQAHAGFANNLLAAYGLSQQQGGGGGGGSYYNANNPYPV